MPQAPKYFKSNKSYKPKAQSPYDWKWQQLRLSILNEHPLCNVCQQRLAVEVDHIVKISDGGPVHDRNNCQAICKDCHNSKTLSERTYYK